MTKANGIKIAIDRGGTFTDVLAIIPGKEDYVFKLLSVDPSNYADANIEGIRRVLEHFHGIDIPRKTQLDISAIESIRLGTTVATNALLERKGVPTALVTTEGFKDILHIGNQSRPDLFALNIVKPEVLYKRVIEVAERVTLPAFSEDASEYDAMDLIDDKTYVLGSTKEVVQIIKPLDEEKTRAQLQQLKEDGIRSLAVVLIHGYNFQVHEKRIGEIARAMGFENITLSHEVLPMIKAVNRGQSTCVDAYLTPIVQEYINGLISGFQKGFEDTTRVEFMMSDGGLCDYRKFTGLKLLLSGPAGGVVGQAMTCYDGDEGTHTIGFDMGGTSTDVSRYAGAYEHVFEATTAGIKLAAPQLDINTVAAGGGSILTYKNGLYCVGPESSSAHPGPVCYRKNGQNLTITDANLMCGRIQAEFFPKIFGPNEDEELDTEAVVTKFEELATKINAEHPEANPKTPYEVALGFLDVANVAMAKPIRHLTENKGFDVSKHNLASFGGAGGQHAVPLAKVLKMKRVVIHRYSSILSAYGIAMADIIHEAQEPTLREYSEESRSILLEDCESLKKRVFEELSEQGVNDVDYQIFLNMGYKGSDSKLMISESNGKDFLTIFYETHEREFSFNDSSKPVIVMDIRVRGVGNVNKIRERSPFEDLKKIELFDIKKDLAKTVRPLYFSGGFQNSEIYNLDDLPIGGKVSGPALVLDATQTILLEPFSFLTVLPRHVIVDLEEDSTLDAIEATNVVDPVQLSIFSHRFMSIAESMCTTLQKISVSANIKERMDFSCALFDKDGSLVANAPAVPVHLSAMSFAVKWQINYWGKNINPGDVLATNHPNAKGTHLPDITIISPVFVDGVIRFYLGSRAHHAEIGGSVAGSMDSSATHLDMEGAKFEAWKVVENGKFDNDGIQRYFVDDLKNIPGSSPSRKVSDNISDIKAAIAANQKGINLLKDLFTEYNTETVLFYMNAINQTSECSVRNFLKRLAKERREALPLTTVDYMDDGARIQLSISIDEENGSALFDFTGTAEETFNCFNAPCSITYACITYCLRCHITDGDLPLNEGVLNPIEVRIPEGTVLNPSITAAVSGGNGITSQKITDVIMKAFGTVAASYGCMNCLCFGQGGLDKTTGEMLPGFGFCETIGGGSGAGNGFHGFSGTQCNMTNTLMTDPEVLEQRYPVVLKQFAVRQGSAGVGKWNGGEGLVRELEFTSPCHASILTQRRVFAPYGMAGGSEGGRGQNRLGRVGDDGVTIYWKHVGPTAEIDVNKGDIIKISTPGGGGYGVPDGENTSLISKPIGYVARAGGSWGKYVESLNTSQ
ncbi:CIC11C00000003337 [Sungouiella intermedia]|uniref:CIC11C00000003337 n=1 Tax=Sungouiella intermedia TaxID=45354 RepID=A0A1L0GSH6_9ASCO|nr:CIC11C00000003337 [[Candida] intermedia]